jgi:hypothetical protein
MCYTNHTVSLFYWQEDRDISWYVEFRRSRIARGQPGTLTLHNDSHTPGVPLTIVWGVTLLWLWGNTWHRWKWLFYVTDYEFLYVYGIRVKASPVTEQNRTEDSRCYRQAALYENWRAERVFLEQTIVKLLVTARQHQRLRTLCCCFGINKRWHS